MSVTRHRTTAGERGTVVNASITAAATMAGATATDTVLRLQAVETAALAATAALGVVSAPQAASKGTTLSRILAARECRWAAPEPGPTQFVYALEVGGNTAAGALATTLLLQAVVAAAAACARRFRHVSVLHLAVLSYYGPNVAALSMALLSGGDGGVAAYAACAGLVLNASLLAVATASAWGLAGHHRSLWEDARDQKSKLVRVYGAVDLACAFSVGVLSGAGGLACATRGALICAACLVNLAHAALVRPATQLLDNALSVTTALLLFGVALVSAAAPREPTYDSALVVLAAAVTAWFYLLLALALVGSVRRCAVSK
mgnify:FL=1